MWYCAVNCSLGLQIVLGLPCLVLGVIVSQPLHIIKNGSLTILGQLGQGHTCSTHPGNLVSQNLLDDVLVIGFFVVDSLVHYVRLLLLFFLLGAERNLLLAG